MYVVDLGSQYTWRTSSEQVSSRMKWLRPAVDEKFPPDYHFFYPFKILFKFSVSLSNNVYRFIAEKISGRRESWNCPKYGARSLNEMSPHARLKKSIYKYLTIVIWNTLKQAQRSFVFWSINSKFYQFQDVCYPHLASPRHRYVILLESYKNKKHFSFLCFSTTMQ